MRARYPPYEHPCEHILSDPGGREYHCGATPDRRQLTGHKCRLQTPACSGRHGRTHPGRPGSKNMQQKVIDVATP